MLFRTVLIAAALLFVAPVAAQAQDDVKLSPAYERCMEKPENSTTYGILQCGDAEIAVQDARLNKAYKADMADLADAPDVKAALLKAQRAWIAFRDANCWAEAAPYTTGSIQPLVFSSCMARLTRQRTKDLTQMTGY